MGGLISSGPVFGGGLLITLSAMILELRVPVTGFHTKTFEKSSSVGKSVTSQQATQAGLNKVKVTVPSLTSRGVWHDDVTLTTTAETDPDWTANDQWSKAVFLFAIAGLLTLCCVGLCCRYLICRHKLKTIARNTSRREKISSRHAMLKEMADSGLIPVYNDKV